MFNRYNRNALLFPSVTFLARVPGAKALHRSIGGLDPLIKQAVDTCFALPNLTFNGAIVGYGAGKCPNLINCIYNNLDAADQAGLSAGTSIACLLPTVLALIGECHIQEQKILERNPEDTASCVALQFGDPDSLSGRRRSYRTHPTSIRVAYTSSSNMSIRCRPSLWPLPPTPHRVPRLRRPL